MLSLIDLFSPIRADIERAARAFREELGSDQAFIQELCDHVEQYHGKQLRPAFLLMSAAACGGVQPEHHTLAAVVEMVHLATLVHDDVLDDAEMRRGAATVNRLVGNERSVLLGDILFSHAYHLCSGLDSQFAARLIARTAVRVCEGEMMQVANRDNYDLSEALYLDIVARKTAALIGAAGVLGARYADADEETIWRMHEFGVALGIAFQIIDDLLDITGDEREVGKTLGRDVDKGKLTLAPIHYLRTQAPAQRRRLRELLRSTSPHREVAVLLAESDSIEYANQTAYSYIQRALEQISDLPESEAKDALRAMAEFVADRRY